MKIPSLKEVVDFYQLTPHVEGGFYNRTYRSPFILPKSSLPTNFGDDRTASSTILYLVPANKVSKIHRLKGDEIWHFYMGNPFTLVEFRENEKMKQTIMGNTSLHDQRVQHLVPNGCWFGGYVNPEGSYGYSLVGCTIFPGFDERDMELGERNTLLKQFSHYQKEIELFFND